MYCTVDIWRVLFPFLWEGYLKNTLNKISSNLEKKGPHGVKDKLVVIGQRSRSVWPDRFPFLQNHPLELKLVELIRYWCLRVKGQVNAPEGTLFVQTQYLTWTQHLHRHACQLNSHNHKIVILVLFVPFYMCFFNFLLVNTVISV